MRKYIKKVALELIEDLRNANSWVAAFDFDSLSEQTAQEIFEVLTVEQETAIKLGEEIENSEGEGTAGIKLLEDYCELLWQISQANEKEQHKQFIQQLESLLEKIREEIQNLPEQYEIVFLPYKASMWDCMESVWMAAKADADCIVKVIPIPYFDRDNDGKVSEMHYEAELMPEYVETTHYNAYNLEEKHPEIVYIHNPYDGGNFVTCVHSDYFSSELKKCTDMLVYIPYFMGGVGPYAEMHWNLPAYRNIDKIIVQDGSKLEGLNQFIPLEKIVVAGTPKADRVFRLEAEKQSIVDTQIPKEWRDKIQGKRVFLYNVSISGVLENSATALDKIKHVLSLFAVREDIVLLWRPHPLIESTLKALRPELYQEYIKIKDEFIEQNKGIFDETADAGISVAISDAYIGEITSSLVHYFGLAGKNVFYTDWKVQKKDIDKQGAVLVSDCFYDDNYLYFTPNEIDLEYRLYKLDLITGEMSLDTIMPGVAQGMHNVYGTMDLYKYCGIVAVRNKVVLAGCYADDIYVYDRQTKQAIKLLLSENCREALFNRIILYHDNVFLKPQNYPAIVKVDVDTYEITEYKDCVSSFLSKGYPKSGRVFAWADIIIGHHLYMSAAMESKMLIFNMEDSTYEIRKIGEYDYGYFSMIYDGKFYWLSAWGKETIVRWDERTGETIEITYELENAANVNINGASLIEIDNTLFVFHSSQSKIHKIDKETLTVEIEDIFEDNPQNINGYSGLEGYEFARKLGEKKILAFHRGECSFVIWDVVTGERMIHPVCMSHEELLEVERDRVEELKRYDGIPVGIMEADVSVEKFVDYVANLCQVTDRKAQNVYKSCMVNAEQDTGMKIHNIIKNNYKE